MELTALPIHFEDRSGTEFERLVFAYAVREKYWDSIEWLGQTGKDGGRDIWADSKGQTTCYICANYQKLTLKKATDDIDSLVKNKHIPSVLIVACGGTITANIRNQIKTYSAGVGIKKTAIWSGVEFEENLRKYNPELIKRFVMGDQFPDSPADLIKFAKTLDDTNDKDIIDLLAGCFDRPAFTTPFHMESSIPDFERALKHTIEVLNTGVQRLYDGTSFKVIPSRHNITDQKLKAELAEITKLVIKLRDKFTQLKNKKEIEPCSCTESDCSVYTLTSNACDIMDKARNEILDKFKKIKPDFNISIY